MILALRTDKPEAELYLYADAKEQVDSLTWLAHRELSDTLLEKIEILLKRNSQSLDKITGICVYKGPGSFTGLRIGITVANTLAYSLQIPIIGSTGDTWLTNCLRNLTVQSRTTAILPEYGSEAHITQPRK